MRKLFQLILRGWTKWRLTQITRAFHRAWLEADKRMKAAGMYRYERRQFKRDLFAGRTSDLEKLLET